MSPETAAEQYFVTRLLLMRQELTILWPQCAVAMQRPELCLHITSLVQELDALQAALLRPAADDTQPYTPGV